MQVAQFTEDRALNAHLARTDRFADLSELSFADLLSLEDDLSEGSQWSLLDDVRSELIERRASASVALLNLFASCCDNGGTLPVVSAGEVKQVEIADYLRDVMSTNWGAELGVEMLVHAHSRKLVISRIGAEFVKDSCDDLLRAGWTQ